VSDAYVGISVGQIESPASVPSRIGRIRKEAFMRDSLEVYGRHHTYSPEISKRDCQFFVS
jgi:hypothetical protein